MKIGKWKIMTVLDRPTRQASIKESRSMGRKLGNQLFTHPLKAVRTYQKFNVSGKRIWSERSRSAFLEEYEKEKRKHWPPRWLR